VASRRRQALARPPWLMQVPLTHLSSCRRRISSASWRPTSPWVPSPRRRQRQSSG
ncbi:hypothetical protein LPJ61_000683, partial [Coemansia biformis]